MKNWNIKNRTALKLLLLLLPFMLGIIGFKMARSEYNYVDAAYASMQMYFANIPIDWQYNIYINIGRWLAPFCAIFLGIGLIADLIRGMIWPEFWAKLPSHYVVYGDTPWIQMLCGENRSPFSKYCIMDRNRFVNCSNYVLLFDSERKNLDFYTSFLLPKIKNKNTKVYMNLLALEPQDIQAKNLVTFQVNSFMALSFFNDPKWVDFERSLIEQKKGSAVKIGLVGFGDLGKRMLQSALVMNIVSETQKIEYHIWGDVASYRKKHRGLNDQNLKPDRIVFHEDDVNGHLQFMEDFDIIFLCGQQEENLLVH